MSSICESPTKHWWKYDDDDHGCNLGGNFGDRSDLLPLASFHRSCNSIQLLFGGFWFFIFKHFLCFFLASAEALYVWWDLQQHQHFHNSSSSENMISVPRVNQDHMHSVNSSHWTEQHQAKFLHELPRSTLQYKTIWFVIFFSSKFKSVFKCEL